MTTPDALKLAEQLDNDRSGSFYLTEVAACLRQQHAALESLRAAPGCQCGDDDVCAIAKERAELRAEVQEQARLNGIGAERELALRAERDALMREVESLRAGRAVPDGECHDHGVHDMLRDWLAEADSRNNTLIQHLRAVLEVARTWQPDYATAMDIKTLDLASAEVGHTPPSAAPTPPQAEQLRMIRDANRYLWWVSTMFNKPSYVARVLAACKSPDEVDAAIDAAMNGEEPATPQAEQAGK